MSAINIDSTAILAVVAVLGAVVATSRWSYGVVSRYFEDRTVKKSFNVRLATVEVAVKDIPDIKASVDLLVADRGTNGGKSGKDQNNRIEKMLNDLTGRP